MAGPSGSQQCAVFFGPRNVIQGHGARQATGFESLEPVAWVTRGERLLGLGRFRSKCGQAFRPAASRPFTFKPFLLGTHAPTFSAAADGFAVRVPSHAFVPCGAEVAWEDAQVEEASSAGTD